MLPINSERDLFEQEDLLEGDKAVLVGYRVELVFPVYYFWPTKDAVYIPALRKEQFVAVAFHSEHSILVFSTATDFEIDDLVTLLPELDHLIGFHSFKMLLHFCVGISLV